MNKGSIDQPGAERDGLLFFRSTCHLGSLPPYPPQVIAEPLFVFSKTSHGDLHFIEMGDIFSEQGVRDQQHINSFLTKIIKRCIYRLTLEFAKNSGWNIGRFHLNCSNDMFYSLVILY